jgi:hypothetical protein
LAGKIVKVRSWEEFKRLVNELKPNAIVYNIEQYGFSDTRELTALRLMMQGPDKYYIFLDFRREGRLKETGIPVDVDKNGNRYIEEKKVKDFLKAQFEREDLIICSYWTI